MRKCEYSKCGKDFEPNKPKQRFCSDVHRVYHNREQKRTPVEVKKDLNDKKRDLSERKTQIISDSKIPPMPVIEKGEHPIDFAARKNEWKRLYSN